MPKRPEKKASDDSARRHLLDAARKTFAARGFWDAGVGEICRAAGLTTGALYHHFEDKEGLFRAVSEEVSRAVIERAAAAMATRSDPWEAFRAAIGSVLDSCCLPEVRVVYNEAHVVLGLSEWERIEGEASSGSFEAIVANLIEAGVIVAVPVGPLARVIRGAVVQGAMAITASKDPASTRVIVSDLLDRMLVGLKR